MEIQEVRHINVFHAELIGFALMIDAARRVIIDLNALHLKTNVAMLDTSIELCVAINEIHSSNVMSHQRQNLLFCFLINNRSSVWIVVLKI